MPLLHLFVNAFLQGWGTHMADQVTSGLWSDEPCQWHNNNLELVALILSLSHLQEVLRSGRYLYGQHHSRVAEAFSRPDKVAQ